MSVNIKLKLSIPSEPFYFFSPDKGSISVVDIDPYPALPAKLLATVARARWRKDKAYLCEQKPH